MQLDTNVLQVYNITHTIFFSESLYHTHNKTAFELYTVLTAMNNHKNQIKIAILFDT